MLIIIWEGRLGLGVVVHPPGMLGLGLWWQVNLAGRQKSCIQKVSWPTH
jgi:hypothetical protein